MTGASAKPPGGGATKIVRYRNRAGALVEYRYARKPRSPRPPDGALRRLFDEYSESPEFLRLAPEWRARKLWLFKLIERELGWMSVAQLEDRRARTEFYELRDKYAALPHRADKMMQSLCSVLSWAYDRGKIAVNHAQRIGALTDPKDSPHQDKTYTAAQEATLLAALPDDLRRLYLFALYTGLRRADFCNAGWADLGADGWLVVRPAKTMRSSRAQVHLPTFALEPLRDLIKELPRRGPTILTTDTGLAWTLANASHRWRRAMLRLGLGGMRLHDIRHASANRLTEAGCTEAERGAIMGQALAHGSGAVYVARTRQLSLNAYVKLNRWLTSGAAIVPLFGAGDKIQSGGQSA